MTFIQLIIGALMTIFVIFVIILFGAYFETRADKKKSREDKQ
jgi:hypothetical protein